MKKGLTELVFILDRSGSMSGLESDTIGGFNSMLEKQSKVEGECVITTVLFDNNYELLHDRIDIRAVSPITDKEYYVRGTTALVDAMGATIEKIANVQKNTSEEFKAEKVMFIIITDGYENASREYTTDKVKALVERQKKEFEWEFIFLGANIDAFSVASQYGIEKDRIANYHADSEGTLYNYDVMSKTISKTRLAKSMKEAKADINYCLDKINEDYEKRPKGKKVKK